MPLDFVGDLIAGQIGSSIGHRFRRWWMPRPVTHPDGSVTVPGAVHGFEARSWATHRGGICGYVTVAAAKVPHSLDSAGRVSRRLLRRQGARAAVDDARPGTTGGLAARGGRAAGGAR